METSPLEPGARPPVDPNADTSKPQPKAVTGRISSLRLESLQRLGEFVIEKRIGKGGMGVVFLASQISLQRKVALKVLPLSMAEDESFCQRFLLEARSAAALAHPNVIQVYTVGIDDATNRLYFAMEYVEGQSLTEYLAPGDPTFGQTLHIAKSVARALEHAWEQQLVHRDIKPGNVMIGPKNQVKVLDFGLAKSLQEQTGLTRTGTIVGTPDYMSPEQAGARSTDCRSDLYSLGVLLYRMLAGDRPFSADSVAGMIFLHSYAVPRRISFYRKNVPQQFENVLRRTLGKDPEDRYDNPRQLLADLKDIRAHLEAEGLMGIKPSGDKVQPVGFKEAQAKIDKGDLLDLKRPDPQDSRSKVAAKSAVDVRQGSSGGRLVLLLLGLLVVGVAVAYVSGKLDGFLPDAGAGQGNQAAQANVGSSGNASNAGALTQPPPADSSAPVEVEPSEPELAQISWDTGALVWDPAVGLVENGDGYNWSFDSFGDYPEALIGSGEGFLSYHLEGPWRLDGQFVNFGATEFGLYVDVGGAPHLGVGFQDFGSGYFRSVEGWKPDARERSEKGAPELQPFESMIGFELQVGSRAIELRVDGQLVLERVLAQPVSGFSLYVKGGNSGFRHLRLRRPVSE